MEFRHLEAFVAVVDCNSFSQAAQRLCLTQPTVTTNIQALEKELQVLLLVRSTKKLALTSEGKLFYEYASNMLNLRQKAQREFKREEKPLINIGASTIPSSYILPELMSQYRQLHPEVRFQVWQSDSLGVVEKLQEGNLDLGFTGTLIEDKGCIFEPFYRDELVLATPASDYYWSWSQKEDFWPEALKEPWIWRENSSGTAREAEKYLQKRGISNAWTELNIAAILNDQKAVVNGIKAGLGISIVSKRAAAELKARGQILTFSLAENYRFLYLVTLRHKIYTSPTNSFLKFIRNFAFNSQTNSEEK